MEGRKAEDTLAASRACVSSGHTGGWAKLLPAALLLSLLECALYAFSFSSGWAVPAGMVRYLVTEMEELYYSLVGDICYNYVANAAS